jgi:nucleoside-diphosphate-sugar epimerase
MRILLTGGTGNVGRATVARLVDGGHEITVIGRSAGKSIPGASYRKCDVNNFAELIEATKGNEAIVHLAAIGTPIGRPGRELFRVNDLGTFNVFEAAARAGISRVVAASSINALGYFFGDKSFPLRYLPVDEAHPVSATDAYSFSKQIMEEIGRYFWERDGISSAMLRLPGVFRHAMVAESRDPYRTYDSALIRNLLELSDTERHQELQRLQAAYDRFRRASRADETDFPNWERIIPGVNDFLTPDELAFMGHNTNFFTYVDELDCAAAIEQALTAAYEGSHALFINSNRNSLGLPFSQIVKLYPWQAELRNPSPPDDSLVSIDRARALIGFEPEWKLDPAPL